jgi:hypothetical protein
MNLVDGTGKVIRKDTSYSSQADYMSIDDRVADTALGTLEVARDVTWGALSYLPAVGAKHIAVGSMKLGRAMGSTDLVNVSDEEIAQIGQDLEEFIMTCGGTAQAKTKSGQDAEELLSKLFTPISELAHWTAQGIDKDTYPNLHELVADGIELGIFAAVPKLVSKGKEVIKKKNAGAKPSDLKAEIDSLFAEADAAIKDGRINRIKDTDKIIKDYHARNQQIIDAMDIFNDDPLGKLKHKSIEDVDVNPYKSRPGELQANIYGDANPKVFVGTNMAKALFNITPNELAKFPIKPKVFRTAQAFFDRHPVLKPLMEKARDYDIAMNKEVKSEINYINNLSKIFPDKKLRQQVGTNWHKKTESGQQAMVNQQAQGMGNKAKEKGYAALQGYIEPKFKHLIESVINPARVALGHRPIKKMKHYLPFFARESMWDTFKQTLEGGSKKTYKESTLVTDPLDVITSRHSVSAADMPSFGHIQRDGAIDGVKIKTDPLAIYDIYMRQGYRHAYFSPVTAMVKEITTKKLTFPGSPRAMSFYDYNAPVAHELISWSNKVAGTSNLTLSKGLDSFITAGSKNLTLATLGFNIRTMLVQPTAIIPVYAKYGMNATADGIYSYMSKEYLPTHKSRVLANRSMDANMINSQKLIAGSKSQKLMAHVDSASMSPMQKIDYALAEMAWRTSYKNVKGKMPQREAIRYADAEVVRTQGSGSPIDLAPIQRNALGKAITLWQTFTINHANWIAQELFGINNPKHNKVKAIGVATRYMIGVQIVNTLFEDVAKIQSPMPAPLRAIYKGLKRNDPAAVIALNTVFEAMEGLPIVGSVKYGSHPLGALVDNFGDAYKALSGRDVFKKDLLPKAMNGDKQAIATIAEIVGKFTGVPGTAQGAKFMRGIKRGEHPVRAAIGRIDTPRKKGKRRRSRRKRS